MSRESQLLMTYLLHHPPMDWWISGQAPLIEKHRKLFKKSYFDIEFPMSYCSRCCFHIIFHIYKHESDIICKKKNKKKKTNKSNKNKKLIFQQNFLVTHIVPSSGSILVINNTTYSSQCCFRIFIFIKKRLSIFIVINNNNYPPLPTPSWRYVIIWSLLNSNGSNFWSSDDTSTTSGIGENRSAIRKLFDAL